MTGPPAVPTSRTSRSEEAARRLGDLLSGLGAADADAVFVGAGGIDTDADAEQLRRLVAPHAPHADVTVIHDTRLILAAGGTDTGIAIISGTGSAAWGINAAGQTGRAGGWGYLLGDEGSGYWFGREAVRHSLDRANRGQDIDQLTRELLGYCGLAAPEATDQPLPRPGRPALLGRRLTPGLRRRRRPDTVPASASSTPGPVIWLDQAAAVAAQIGIRGPVVLGGGLVTNQPAFQQSITAHLQDLRLDRYPRPVPGTGFRRPGIRPGPRPGLRRCR